ncbi:DUF3817 domain-containing protein [Psychroserpens sp. SPM9]|uniref:DUF3817 domain-containing protein n=1 Tax=Psychroserpens sp. SPM9 TaxID=2975598 RepID=UPI0021A7B67E|nr:DUF3817 domain-containing protein [Psychroserpens sp. SPM9]MDG5491600.1 DUF3817 domain-containing protein [Psychroserpens sp. SPM9]
MFSLLNCFRIIALLEGVSYILLLFIASPYKLLTEDDTYVKLLGMPHGILFLIYIVLAIIVGQELKWNAKTQAFVILASIIPFGTFYVEKKYLKPNK